MKQRKPQMIKARVSTNMKRGIDDLADQRGESEAVIVREALSQYLRKSTILFKASDCISQKTKLIPLASRWLTRINQDGCYGSLSPLPR